MKTIKARYSAGKLEPLEKLELAEGTEVTLAIVGESSPAKPSGSITDLAGAWVGLVDFDRFLEEIYAGRGRSPQRPFTQLDE